MNFIKALEKAQELGVTKDEFIRVWEAELKVNPNNEHNGSVSQASPNEINQGCAGHQFAQQWQQSKDELKQALYVKFQSLLDQHIEQQEHMWEQVHNVNDQTAQDFRQQCDIICQHISNTVESQTSSLKLYFMQELEIMKQNLEKMIDDRYKKYEAAALSSVSSLKMTKVDFNQESGNTNKSNLKLNNVKDNTGGSELLSMAGHRTLRLAQKEIVQEKQNEDNLPDLVYDWQMETMDGTPLRKDRVANNSGKEEKYEGAIHSIPSHLNEKKGSCSSYVRVEKDEFFTNESETDYWVPSGPLYPASSVTSLNDEYETDISTVGSFNPAFSANGESITATGFYAEAISDQIKRWDVQRCSNTNDMAVTDDWGDSSEHETADSTVTGDDKDPVPLRVFKYVHWHGFSIADIDTYSNSGIYLSPFLYPGTQSCKARLCIGFSAKKQLKVHVCVTQGDSDKQHEWPIRITANGFIFHVNSKRFTQIWALPWVTCYKPSSREVRFPAKICLATKRGSYPDVTYDELKKKLYLESNKATLKWNITAEKPRHGHTIEW